MAHTSFTMASRLSLRALRPRASPAQTLPGSRLPVTPAIRGTSPFSTKTDAAQERLSSATAAWIARLKAQHGEGGWKAVFDESQARQERNLAEMRERHKQQRAARQEYHQVEVDAAAQRKAEGAMTHELMRQAAQEKRVEKARKEAERAGTGKKAKRAAKRAERVERAETGKKATRETGPQSGTSSRGKTASF